MEAIGWIEQTIVDDRAAGRRPLFAEVEGEAEFAGVTVHGKVDRIDRLADGAIAIVDYKTGQAPDKKAIAAGYALQLGLLGIIAQSGGFGPAANTPRAFEYWSLARDRDGDGFGYVRDAASAIDDGDVLALTREKFADAASRWLLGDEGFKAKLNPAYSHYGNYDQLMRLEEWYARAK
jgi:ATP-dependent helicase/nuclease subunit B